MTTDHTDHNASDGMDWSVSRQPISRVLVQSSIVLFTGAFITDLVYWWTLEVMWETFSDWLLTAGMIVAGAAIIALLIDLIRGKQVRALSWPQAVGYVLAILLSLVNAFVHSRDGYTAVVPTGLTLSALVVIILLLAASVDRALISRRRVGAST